MKSKEQRIRNLHLEAFGKTEGPIVSELAGAFLTLPDSISICVERDDKEVGNIIFTPFHLNDHPDKVCFLLAPLGVLPEFQRQGVGAELIAKGITHLKSLDADAIFVLGHPRYYALRGFEPARVLSPYHEVMTHHEAWKMLEIKPGSMSGAGGTSMAAKPIMKREFWDTSGRPS